MPLTTAVGMACLASLATSNVVVADENLFVANALGSGYDLIAKAEVEGKCGEGTCGESHSDADSGAGKDAEGKCGEGTCGESHTAAGAGSGKDAEGKCGEGKCGASA